ncbi:Major facilitator superfamily domain general substrate transporter [Penicillium concentricum]|uniref:Major facilitator superfamily domain general substrate transporter n=1 Tax=Penicillium concentricum TaxID=293559 RepID=A0A9W9S8C4_9EURO|nr:Major facilitator superfamily domain general substrate transporter [Penicillium concentricum]KAJ5373715.1 Major facilitator superfamily domain general substrate transporter [Penicillium concentricum]
MAGSSSMRDFRDQTYTNRDDIPLKEAGTEESDDDEEKQVYPPSSKLAPILIGLCFQSFCIALDNTILSTAVPKITEQFNSLGDISWYASAYLLTTCAVTLPFGKVYTYYSTKWTYMVALCLFEIGSLICAVTPTSKGLIFGRAIAGIGSGGLSPGALLVLANSVPLHRRALYFGIIGSTSGIATITGPLLGGLLTDHVSWRWCFWINLPFGVLTGLVILIFFKDSTSPKPKISRLGQLKRMDPFGVLAFIPAVVSLLLGLQWGGTKYSWNNPRIIALFVLFGVFSSVWCIIQVWKQDDATVPPRLLKNRNVLGAVIHATFLGGSFFVFGYYLPIWFQAVKEDSASESGINNLPMVIAMIVFSALGGLLVNILGYYTPLMFVGSAFLTIGSGLCTTFKVNSGHPQWIGYQVILGIGAGLGFQQCINALQTVLPLRDIPIGIAIITFAQSLSGAMFISIAQTVFENRLVASIAANAPNVSPNALINAGAANLSQRVPKDILPSVLYAYNIAVIQTFYVSVAGALLSFIGAGLVQWKSMKRRQKYDVAG